MKKNFALLVLPLLVCPLLAQQEKSGVKSTALVLTHVTLIDGTGAPPQQDVTVVIAGHRIAEIADSREVHIPKDAIVRNEEGKFLIPGLWDMHVHPHGKEYLPLFIANGITGIRIMWGDPEDYRWRKEVEAGMLVAPHMLIASPIIDGPRPFWPGSVAVSSEAEARAAVVNAKRTGADFVKVYTFLPREEYFAIADEAKKNAIPFEGHIPEAVSAEEASRAGQKSVEHLTGILRACSTQSGELDVAAKRDLDDYLANGPRQFEGQHMHALRSQMLETYSLEKAAALFALFKKNATWQTPTLTLWRMFSSLNDPSFTDDPHLKYVPVRERESWDPVHLSQQSVSQNTALSKSDFAMDLRVVGAMQKAGVGLLAGTDTGNPYCISGFSLHGELKLLTDAGLTPMEALQAATLNPARFMGKESDFGTVTKGKFADLVLLDANPLEDIRNTQKISAVVFEGAFYPRSSLDTMLSGVEAFANRKPVGDVLFKTIQEKNLQAAVEQFYLLKKEHPDAYDFSENELIGLGYQMLRMKKITDAIEVFKLSVEAYPQSYNCYDSLAEAYMDHGDKDQAIQNYRKSLELNPENKNGEKMLNKLLSE